MTTDSKVVAFQNQLVRRLPNNVDAVPKLITNSSGILAYAVRWNIAEGRLLENTATLDCVRKAVRWLGDGGVLLVDSNSQLLSRICIISHLSPKRRWRLVMLDAILSPGKGVFGLLKTRLKGALYSAVDEHLVYFRDTAGYTQQYGIPAQCMRYVRFKVNCWPEIQTLPVREGDGDYMLCAGRTRRDFATFGEAAKRSKVPCVLLHQEAAVLREHGTEAEMPDLPENVRLELHQGDSESWIRWMRNARAVVIPVLPNTIASTGISTYLDAMALGVPVIITECPAVRGLLTDEALVVPASDPDALATAMRRIWEDVDLRQGYSARGQRYAYAMGGADRLYSDVLTMLFNSTG